MVVPLDFKSKDKVKNVSINLILNTSRTQVSSDASKSEVSPPVPSYTPMTQSPPTASGGTSISSTSIASLVKIPPQVVDTLLHRINQDDRSPSQTHLDYSHTLIKRKSEDATSMTSAGQKSPITPPPKLPPIDKSMFPRSYSHPTELEKQETQSSHLVAQQTLLQPTQQQHSQVPLQNLLTQPSFYYPIQTSGTGTLPSEGAATSDRPIIALQPISKTNASHVSLPTQTATVPIVRDSIEYLQNSGPFTPGYYYLPSDSTTYYVTHPLGIPNGSFRYGGFPQLNDIPVNERGIAGSSFQGFPPHAMNATTNQPYHSSITSSYAYSQHDFNPKDVFKHRTRRFRRRYNQVVRKYACSFKGCTKSYGSLNHLNTHIVTKGHGQRKSKADFTSKEELLGINEPMERASEEISWNPNDPSGSPDRINRQAQTVFMEPSGNYWYGIQPQSVYFDQNKQPVFVQNPHSEPHPIQMLPGQPVTVQQKPQAHQSQIPLISQAHYLPIGQVSGFPTISVSPGEHNNSLNSTYPHQAPARSSISQQGYVLSPPHFLLPGTVVKPETQSDSTTDTQKK